MMESTGFLCDSCSEIFHEEIELRTHVAEEHNDLCFAVANYSSSGESDITAISLISDQNKRMKNSTRKMMTSRRRAARLFTCDKCEYTTKIKASMKVHKLVHTVDCPYCQFKTVKQSSLKEHIVSDHQAQMLVPVTGDMVEYVGTAARNEEEFISGDRANQRLLNKITPSEDLLTGEFSYIGDISRPKVIVSKEAVLMTERAFQFLAEAENTKQEDVEEEMIEVEEEQIEVIVPDDAGLMMNEDSNDNTCNWMIV